MVDADYYCSFWRTVTELLMGSCRLYLAGLLALINLCLQNNYPVFTFLFIVNFLHPLEFWYQLGLLSCSRGTVLKIFFLLNNLCLVYFYSEFCLPYFRFCLSTFFSISVMLSWLLSLALISYSHLLSFLWTLFCWWAWLNGLQPVVEGAQCGFFILNEGEEK